MYPIQETGLRQVQIQPSVGMPIFSWSRMLSVHGNGCLVLGAVFFSCFYTVGGDLRLGRGGPCHHEASYETTLCRYGRQLRETCRALRFFQCKNGSEVRGCRGPSAQTARERKEQASDRDPSTKEHNYITKQAQGESTINKIYPLSKRRINGHRRAPNVCCEEAL